MNRKQTIATVKKKLGMPVGIVEVQKNVPQHVTVAALVVRSALVRLQGCGHGSPYFHPPVPRMPSESQGW